MRKILTALTAAAVLAAGTMTMTTKANAFWWVVPAIVGAGVGGLAIGAAAEQNNVYYEGGPRGTVYVRPSGYGYDCRIIDEQTPSGRMRHVRVCD